MANNDSTLANQDRSKASDFVTIPVYFFHEVNKQFSAYVPIVMIDGEYDDVLGVEVGKSISLKPETNMEDALEAARIACLSKTGAIGYAVKGVDHE